MAKIFSYTIILAVMLAVMNVAGVGHVSSFLTAMGFSNPASWGTSTFLLTLMAIIVGASIIGIGASFFGRSPSESYILGIGTTFGAGGLLILAIIEFGLTLNDISNLGLPWLTSIMSVLFFGIVAGYTIALVQFWRGNDI